MGQTEHAVSLFALGAHLTLGTVIFVGWGGGSRFLRDFHLRSVLLRVIILAVLCAIVSILLCRALGKNQLVLGGADSPTSVILSIPSAIPSWLVASVVTFGLPYLILSIYMYLRLKG